jgi:two-component system NtrC family sensor kinase
MEPSDAVAPTPETESGQEPLVSLLARHKRRVDLLPHLHRHAVEVTGGACSLLFEYNPRNGVLQATSGYGLDELRIDPWAPQPPEAAIVATCFGHARPTVVAEADNQMPDLADRMGCPAALLLPLAREGERLGLLAIGLEDADVVMSLSAGYSSDTAIQVADAFITALELFRFRQKEDLQRDLRELFGGLSASLASSLNLSSGLDAFCDGAMRLFGADQASVWLHDRRARSLTLVASSESRTAARGAVVPADDPLAPAATAMRDLRSEIVAGPTDALTSRLTVPLRGTRRALGTIVFEGVRVEAGDEFDLLDRADELGRQLSSVIENIQLLDDVMRSRRELENAFDSIAHLVVVTDRRGYIKHANQAFAAQVRQSRDFLINQPLASLIGPDLAAWLAAREDDTAPDAPAAGTTIELVDPVLNGPFMVTATELRNAERERVGTVLVARDLTPHSRLEAEREELRKRLGQSEKLAALGQFVAGIAHELNNPLQGVLGHLELLRVTGAFPKQLRREVQTIYREADRAAKIVRNLLVFAGSRRLARRSVSVPSVLQKVIALRQPACRAQDIEVVRHYAEKLPRVQSDPLLLHQVFLNMFMNAEQAIVAAGRPGRIEVHVGVSPARDRLIATVRDTGNGIPPDALTRIFEPFYTTKEVGKGTGLGLAIAYGIVQEHGGHIAAANHPEGGAMFSVELPVGATGTPRTRVDHD